MSTLTYVPRHAKRFKLFKFFNEAYVKGVVSGFACTVVGTVVWNMVRGYF